MGRSKVKDRRRVGDYWSRKAKTENYPARSVYKLKEIDDKHRLFKSGFRVLDLGCAPGSWTKYAAEKIGPGGLVYGLDLTLVEEDFGPNVRLVQADVFEADRAQISGLGPFDVVMSDMAPKTTGIKSVDQDRSLALTEVAVDLALEVLAEGGALLFKVFQGPDVDPLIKGLEKDFKSVRRIKPKSSRSFSVEIFVLALGRRSSVPKNEPAGP